METDKDYYGTEERDDSELFNEKYLGDYTLAGDDPFIRTTKIERLLRPTVKISLSSRELTLTMQSLPKTGTKLFKPTVMLE